jgi:hypothetical protein
LLTACGREHKLYAYIGATDGGFTVGRLWIPREDDYEFRSATSVVLQPDFMKWLHLDYRLARPAGVVEIHSHPFTPHASFSAIDDRWIGGVRGDFERMHAEGVFCRCVVGLEEEGFRLEVWDGSCEAFVAIDEIRIVGRAGERRLRSWLSPASPRSEPEDGTLDADPFYERTAVLRTPAEHRAVRTAHVVLMGCGGLGLECARLLAAVGVGKLTLVDGDRIERRNLNRLVGATPDDAEAARPKVDWLQALLTAHDPAREVVAVAERFPCQGALDAIQTADLVVVAVDSGVARHDVLRFSARHLRPVIDCGTSISLAQDGSREQQRNGHVWLYVPGERRCFHQMGLGGPALWAPSLREAQAQAGYVLDVPGQSPGSVQVANSLVASLGISLAEAYLCGRAPECSVVLVEAASWPAFGLKTVVRRALPDPECPLCGERGVEGQGGNPFAVTGRLPAGEDELPPIPDAVVAMDAAGRIQGVADACR